MTAGSLALRVVPQPFTSFPARGQNFRKDAARFFGSHNTECVTRKPSKDVCVEAYRAVGYPYGLDEYVDVKMALGDSMVETTGDDTRFWIGSPRSEIRNSALSLFYLANLHKARMDDYKEHSKRYELYGKEQILCKLIDVDILNGFMPLFCNSEYDNWLGWVLTRAGYKLIKIDIGLNRVDYVYDTFEQMIESIPLGYFGDETMKDSDGRVVMKDMYD